jgi:hypothetical protein
MDAQTLVEVYGSSGLVAVVLPIIIGWINQHIKGVAAREIIALAMAVATGTGIVYFSGELTGLNLFASVSLIAAVSQIMFVKMWNPKWSEKEEKK